MNNFKTVILAAGESSRFWPFNAAHKSLVKIMGKPLIWHTIQGLKKAGVKDIIIIQGIKKDIEAELKNYDLGVTVNYIIQSEASGMGNALLQAKEHLTKQFFLVLPERIDCEEIVSKLQEKIKVSDAKTILVGAKTETPNLFGILKIKSDKVIDIVEKPKKGEEPSNIKALGIYLLQPDFFDVYEKITKHQYDFEKALSEYIKTHDVGVLLWNKETASLKYPWKVLNIKDYLLNNVEKTIGRNSNISKSAEIIGDVFIGDNVSIMEKVVIKGPAYIGNDVFIGNNAILRGGVDIEEGAVVGANMEVKNALIMKNTTTHSGYIGDSLVGKNCRIAAQFCTANVRLDRGIIKSIIKNEEVATGFKYLGVMIGDNCDIGIKCSAMPGIIIGQNVTIGPSTVILHNIEDNTKYYTKFAEVVSKKNDK